MSAPTPTPATNAPASSGFLSGLFSPKKANASKPANAAAPVAPAVGGRRASRKDRSRRNRNRKDRSRSRKDRSRKDRSRSRKDRK